MKKLYIRTITGAIYVAVIIGAVFAGQFIFLSLLALILMFTLWEFFRMCNLKGYEPQVYIGIIVSLLLYGSLFLLHEKTVAIQYLLPVTLTVLIIPFAELIRGKKQPLENIAITLAGIILIALPFSLFNLILTPWGDQPEKYEPFLFLGLLFIIWSNDTGAYLVGSMIGKHKMAEKISPNKTWEGAIGGAIFSILVSILYFHFFKFFSHGEVFVIALATIIAGTLGDLTESLIKRNCHVKDSGNILPGHGGLFDRFDSLLFAAPVYYILIINFLN